MINVNPSQKLEQVHPKLQNQTFHEYTPSINTPKEHLEPPKMPMMAVQNKVQRPISREPQRPMLSHTPLIKPRPGQVDLGKLNFLVSDPWIQNIECLGPNKKILVLKSGKIYSTPIALNKEEIKNIIEKFSQETRIPTAGGVLKSVHNNLAITALTSEYVGSRFIIQKVNPEKLFPQTNY